MENKTAEQLVSMMSAKLCLLGAKVDSLNSVRNVLSFLAEDANDKIHNDMQKYFLWDNNDHLQMTDDLMYRLMNEVNEEFKQIEEIQTQLFQLLKVGEVVE